MFLRLWVRAPRMRIFCMEPNTIPQVSRPPEVGAVAGPIDPSRSSHWLESNGNQQTSEGVRPDRYSSRSIASRADRRWRRCEALGGLSIARPHGKPPAACAFRDPVDLRGAVIEGGLSGSTAGGITFVQCALRRTLPLSWGTQFAIGLAKERPNPRATRGSLS